MFRMLFIAAASACAALTPAAAQNGGVIVRLDRLEQAVEALQTENQALRSDLNAVTSSSWTSSLRQVQAQAACVAMAPSGGWIRAVVRPQALANGWDILSPNSWKPYQGGHGRVTCTAVCQQLIRHPALGQERRSGRSTSCFNSLHLYGGRQAISDAEDITGLKTYWYGGCGHTATGPNYCCCIAR